MPGRREENAGKRMLKHLSAIWRKGLYLNTYKNRYLSVTIKS